MLELAIEAGVDLSTAVKIALGSMMSTTRANLSVGPPYDVAVLETDAEADLQEFRVEPDSPLIERLREVWERNMLAAVSELPPIFEGDVRRVD